MTEQEWLTCVDPQKMLEKVQRTATERKLRLFACACCRRIWHLLTDERSQKDVEIAELQADNLASIQELTEICDSAASALGAAAYSADAAASVNGRDVRITAMLAADAAMYSSESQSEDERHSEESNQAQLIREMFGNPFHPINLDFSLLTTTVQQLASAIYDEKAFDRMPILADALEEAGCDNTDILNHCRQLGNHVKGCWVVDLLLGKE